MENLINSVVHFLQQVPWDVVGQALVASGIVSVVLQALKKWLSLQSPKVINTLLFVVSSLTVGLNWLLSSSASNPTLLGQQTAAIAGLSGLLYQFFIKPASNVLSDAKQLREQKAALPLSAPPLMTDPVAVAAVSAPAGTTVELTNQAPTPVVEPKTIDVNFIAEPTEPKDNSGEASF